MAKKVAVIGAGIMGHGIAQAFAASGFATTLIDTHPQALKTSLLRIRQNLRSLVALGMMSAAAAKATLGRIATTTQVAQGIEGAAFIQETIPEDLRSKRKLFQMLDEAGGDAVLGSNAATILIKDIAAGMKSRRRIVGVHWLAPAYVVPVVEVIPSRWTEPGVLERTRVLLKKAGKIPVVCKDIPGKIVLRMQFAMLNEAIHLLETGAASAEDIDAAAQLGTGLRLAVFGPLKLTDFVSTHGNTLNGMRFLYQATGNGKFKPPRLLIEKVKQGKMGIWTGEGWYKYPQSYPALAKSRDRSFIRTIAALRKLGIVPR